ncbi:MAG: ABC transporter ATP-binding protein [Bacteroidales bacterium]|nr:ABC transporter ATP-binding protein [Bacteroidales bacterium]
MHESIQVKNITKTYDKVIALNSINFEVEKGELFGLIGPDGAGKTTLLRILTSLLVPDSGEAFMNGYHVVKDYKTIRNIAGYMPGRFSLYQDLTVEENLEFFATTFGTTISENYDLIKDIYIQIEPFKTRLAGRLSGGMKQKLALSCALIHKPEILVLDEPTTGVDAVSRKEFWEMLIRLKNQGITIIVSTPYMDEAGMCDRVALMQKGDILQIDTPEDIAGQFAKKVFAVKAENVYNLLRDIQAFEHTHSVYPFGEYLHYISKTTSNIKEELSNYLDSKNHKSVKIMTVKPDIEDCFMELMTKTVNNGE